jgi:hypothetical protein
MARVRAQTAVVAILGWRRISMVPSGAGGVLGVEQVSLAMLSAVAPAGAVPLDDSVRDQCAEAGAELVESNGGVRMLVGIDSDGHLPTRQVVVHAGHCCCSPLSGCAQRRSAGEGCRVRTAGSGARNGSAATWRSCSEAAGNWWPSAASS